MAHDSDGHLPYLVDESYELRASGRIQGGKGILRVSRNGTLLESIRLTTTAWAVAHTLFEAALQSSDPDDAYVSTKELVRNKTRISKI